MIPASPLHDESLHDIVMASLIIQQHHEQLRQHQHLFQI